jgi:hypothetical protein
MSFLLGRQMLEQLEGQPIWSKTNFFYIFKAVHADQQAASAGVVTKRFAQQQKIAMLKIGKVHIHKFSFPSCRHMIFYY